jgi:hypothetical protein
MVLGVILGIGFVAFGLFMALKPKKFMEIRLSLFLWGSGYSRSWRDYDDEPGEFHVIMTRVAGWFCVAVGMVFVIMIIANM